VPITPAQLEWAWLSKVHFESDPHFDRESVAQWNYVVTPKAEVDELFWGGSGEDPDDQFAWTTVRLQASIEWHRVDDEEADFDPPFTLDIEVTGQFAWRRGTAPDERMAKLWLEYNGQYLLWPYLRQYIAAVTTASNIPVLTIYTMNVPERPSLDEDSSESAVPDELAPRVQDPSE
jgi:hypothetical protein